MRAATTTSRVVPKESLREVLCRQRPRGALGGTAQGRSRTVPERGASHARSRRSMLRLASGSAGHGGAEEIAAGVQEAWRRFHAGDFMGAIAAGGKLGALGATAANKARRHPFAAGSSGEEPTRLLQAAIARGERPSSRCRTRPMRITCWH